MAAEAFGGGAAQTGPGRHRRWAARAAGAALLSLAAGVPVAALASSGIPSGALAPRLPAIDLTWTKTLPDAGNPIAVSSPNLAVLNGTPDVVVGDRAGNLWAFTLGNGTDPKGGVTPLFHAPGPIDSTPSQAPGVDGVAFGVGNAASPYGGGYDLVNADGGLVWSQAVHDQPSDPRPYSAVASGLAVGTAPGVGDFFVSGSVGQEMYALNTGGGVLPGFPFFQGDGDFSTPAVAPLYYGSDFIVDNGDSSGGIAFGHTYTDGSILRVLNTSGQQVCAATTTQSGESSPAVGQLAPNTAPVIVAGSTDYFPGAPDTDHLFVWNAHCAQEWSLALDGVPMAGPALADTQGNGQLQIVEGTNVGGANTSGSVYDVDAGGHVLWAVPALGAVIGSASTVDPTGQGYQDVLVPTTGGVMLLDGRTGRLLATLGSGQAFQSAPLVTTDPDGTIGITVAGYNGANQGVIDHYEIAGSHGNVRAHASTGDVLSQPGGWPMFHHDPQLTGDAGIAPPVVEVHCTKPAGTPRGYDLVADDGGLFNFGNLPFCGSLGALTLNQPVVGIAHTGDAGGYWMVARDGGMFAFGDAKFYGSMGGKPLNAPIVGMAPTPDGKGYWLVASDGGIFSFGDAHFYGSAGDLTLHSPIVGFAATADGKGYWLVAADGGIFSYGDARFHGSTGNLTLDSPVVGMAVDGDGGGYWLVAADGGIFSFHAHYFGSMGGKQLDAPIVGMESTAGGAGYRFVAADGGIFSFGTAPFYGSMGAKPLNAPIVAISGY